jgi:hypothetical protein
MTVNQWSSVLRGKRKYGAQVGPDPDGPDKGEGGIVDSPPLPDYEVYLRCLWQGICGLQFEWQWAFLLGSEVIWDFDTFGVASMAQIASVLKMPAKECAGLANRLPLRGNEIACLLSAKLGLETAIGEKQINSFRWHARDKLLARLEAEFGIKVKEFTKGGNKGKKFASFQIKAISTHASPDDPRD